MQRAPARCGERRHKHSVILNVARIASAQN
jgi:hypothetical protein